MADCSGIPDLNPEELVQIEEERAMFAKLDAMVREGSVEAERFSRAKHRPAVLMFQPTHFVTVTGENLRIWEQLTRNRVGFPVSEDGEPGPPSGTISGCSGGCPPWDDSDA